MRGEEGARGGCATCAFYVAERHQCRAEPPRPVGVATERGALGVWPTVREDDWCGRYSAGTGEGGA